MNAPRKPVRAGVLSDPLDLDAKPKRPAQTYRSVKVPFGTRVMHRATGTYGNVLRILDQVVILEDAFGRERGVSRLPGGFTLQGETVTLIGVTAPADAASPTVRKTASLKPESNGPAKRTTTASGSVVSVNTRAQVAKSSRIWVEGVHDAELVEKVWGEDLRGEAIVVEPLGGIDDVDAAVRSFGPTDERRLGILVDHLVVGSKESRIVASIDDPNVLIVGHPYVDIWQCVRAKSLGIDGWPEVPRSLDWKTGVCQALGWGTPIDGWRRVLSAVNSFADLDPSLVGAVEEMLDFLS